MAGTAVRGRLNWLAADVVAVSAETARARSIALDCPEWPGHLPGQHVDIRLTAEDGYQAQRSYSIATPVDGERITITVELIDDGEVSPYLIEELRVGDLIEVRGPIGGYFVWEPGIGGPLELIAGGSGVVPLMAMIRAQVGANPVTATRLLVSARSHDDLLYRDELVRLADELPALEVDYTLTRSQPPDWTGYASRVDGPMLAATAWPAANEPLCYVCGPTGFVETVAQTLVDQGHDPQRIKTERFGPTRG